MTVRPWKWPRLDESLVKSVADLARYLNKNLEGLSLHTSDVEDALNSQSMVNLAARPYRVVFDDRTDVTAPMNDAINAFPPGGAVFVMPAGVGKVTGTILGRGGDTLIGQGANATTLKNYANTDCLQFVKTRGSRDIHLADFFIDDAIVATRTAGEGILGDGVTGAGPNDSISLMIDRVIVNGHQTGVKLVSVLQCITNKLRCNIQNLDGLGIYGLGTTTIFLAPFMNACKRYGYYVNGGLGYSLWLTPGADSILQEPYYFDAVDPLGGYDVEAVVMVAPGYEGCYAGAYFRDSKYIKLIEPRFGPILASVPPTQKHGLWWHGSARCKVDGGIIFGATGWGINVTDSPTAVADKIAVDDTLITGNALGDINDPNGAVRRWEGALLSANLQVLAKFACNGQAPQAAGALPAAAVDAATTQALANAIRTVLVANGIAV